MSPRPVALAWSGGKDSSLALACLRADPDVEVVALVTTVTRDFDRISMHGVRRSVLQAQVAALGLPLIEATIPAAAGNAVYEESLACALRDARRRRPDLLHLAFGDLFLTDVRAYRESLLARFGWHPVFPLWGRDTAALAREFIEAGYRAILTCVDTAQLAPEFAGREFDAALLADLPAGVDPCGERGEFHTCVYAGPIFRRPLALNPGERVRRDGRFEYCDVALAGQERRVEHGAETNWPEVRRDLLAMAERDLAVRGELAADGSLFHGYHPQMRAVHDANATRLATIIGELGWPGEPQVGRDGAKAAWLIVQHAIAQPDMQRAVLPILREAAERGEVPPLQVAMLEDRIRVFEGRPQRYGTQFDWDASGQMNPLPIEDPEGVDHRRRTLGLTPLADELAERRRATAENQERPPANAPARQREMEAWLHAVGWRR